MMDSGTLAMNNMGFNGQTWLDEGGAH